MSKYNDVFLVIKKRCEGQSRLAEIDCFDLICQETKITESKLPMYLSHLKELGLIDYSLKEKFISLTSRGKNQKEPV